MHVDFGVVLRRAWDITWRNKTLWWLGLFAAGSSTPTFNWNSSINQIGKDSGNGTIPWSGWTDGFSVSQDVSRWLPLLFAIGVVVFVLVVVGIVLSVAAGGGLVSQANEAAEGRRASASRGWGDGFHRWWRLAGIYAVLSLPFLVFGLVVAGASLFVVLIPLAAGSVPRLGSIAALVAVLAIAALFLIPLGIVLGVMQVLAVRYAMIEDRTWSQSLSMAWAAIKSRFKDVALMWLLLVAVSVGFGLALLVPLLIFVMPLIALAIGRLWVPLAFAVFAMAIVMWALGAVFNTFHSAAWTIFWRQMTGREPGKQPAWPAPGGYPQPPYVPAQPGYPQPGYPQPTYPPAPQYPPPPQYPPAQYPPAPQYPEAAPPPQPTYPPAAPEPEDLTAAPDARGADG